MIEASVRTRVRRLRQGLRWQVRLATSPIRLLPDFIIIGAQKSGTSSLYTYLLHHPEIASAAKKEVHFFDNRDYGKGLNWYRAHFPTKTHKWYVEHMEGKRFVTGEASPYYMAYPHAAERIARVLPKIKLIVMLRNPVDRAISHYEHQRRKGREPLSLDEAIDAEGQRIEGEMERMLKDQDYYSYNYWAYSYLARGGYVKQIERWMGYFGRDQFLFLKAEDFFKNPSKEYGRVLRFLGLSSYELQTYGKHNTGTYKRSDRESHQRLREYFKGPNERLYGLLGVDYGWE